MFLGFSAIYQIKYCFRIVTYVRYDDRYYTAIVFDDDAVTINYANLINKINEATARINPAIS